MSNFFTGRACITIEGVNIERLVSQMLAKGFRAYSVKRLEYNKISLILSAKSLNNLIAMLKNSWYTVTIQSVSGVPYIFNFFKKRIGLTVGLIFSVVLAVIFSCFVWSVNIVGNENVLTSTITSKLQSAGFKAGTLISRIDTDKLEQKMMSEITALAMVDISIKGTSLLVVVQEKLDEIAEHSSGDLISMYDAVITKIVTVKGTQKVLAGATVKKGDVLIEGVTVNTAGQSVPCTALGKVYANVWYTGQVEFYEEKTVLVRTSKKVRTSYMTLFGATLPVKNAENKFLFSETETKERYLFDKNIIPFKIVTKTTYELEPIILTDNYEDNKEILEYEALLKARENMPIEYEPIKEYTITSSGAGIYIITAYIQVEIEIGEFVGKDESS